MPLAVIKIRRSTGRTSKRRNEMTGQMAQANVSRRRPPARKGTTKPITSTVRIDSTYQPNDIQPCACPQTSVSTKRRKRTRVLSYKKVAMLRKMAVRVSRSKISLNSIFLERKRYSRTILKVITGLRKKSHRFHKSRKKHRRYEKRSGQTRFAQSDPAKSIANRKSGNPADRMSANMGMQCSRISFSAFF